MYYPLKKIELRGYTFDLFEKDMSKTPGRITKGTQQISDMCLRWDVIAFLGMVLPLCCIFESHF